ncbi:MAG TPA: RT0821/Lpp0805 family surface protein [Gammaproteobacteria bacterium]|nr:RT0821/Lpp0805 family surface protein [Gammaproteobacteria bacterium]
MFKPIAAAVLGASVLLAGCSQQTKNQDVGTVVGGALGGLLGAQVGSGSGRVAAAVAGSIAGALIGGSIGKSMDELDRMKAAQALERVPTGQTSTWQNPDTGNSYAVTPTQTYTSDSGAPCRDYTTEGWIDGKREVIKGTACRQPDGTWRTV